MMLESVRDWIVANRSHEKKKETVAECQVDSGYRPTLDLVADKGAWQGL